MTVGEAVIPLQRPRLNRRSGRRRRALNPAPGRLLCYTVTKAGVTRLTTYIAQEVAQYGIAVNAVAPGLVQSPGGEEIMPEDYKFEGGEIDWKPATLEVLGPYMVWLAQQSAATFTGQVVQGEEFGQTWP